MLQRKREWNALQRTDVQAVHDQRSNAVCVPAASQRVVGAQLLGGPGHNGLFCRPELGSTHQASDQPDYRAATGDDSDYRYGCRVRFIGWLLLYLPAEKH